MAVGSFHPALTLGLSFGHLSLGHTSALVCRTEKPNKKNRPNGRFIYWLGWLDSNQRMTGSKPVALPLGDSPIDTLIPDFTDNGKHFFQNGALGEIRTHDLCLRRATLYPAELQALAPMLYTTNPDERQELFSARDLPR